MLVFVFLRGGLRNEAGIDLRTLPPTCVVAKTRQTHRRDSFDQDTICHARKSQASALSVSDLVLCKVDLFLMPKIPVYVRVELA